MAILGRIRAEKENFRTKSVRIAKGFLFNQYSTLQRIELYYNSQFETGEYDDDDFKKYFYNIVKKPCEIATKEIDLDTKDIIIRPENGDSLLAEIMSRKFKQWTKDEGFASDINEYAEDAPKYGSVVVKKVPKTGKLYTLDLVNGFIITNQNAKNLNHTNIIEPHLYSYDELRTAAEESGWDSDKVEEAITLYQGLEKPDVEVDERYGWVRESELKKDGSANKMVYTLAIVAGAEETETASDKEKVVEKGIVIFHEAIKTHPYREWHFSRIKKRWLGLGFVEALFDPQMARNETKYYKRKGLLWTALHLWQTDDENINKNLLLDMKDGDVIKRSRGSSELTPVAMEERNLADYNSEDIDWDQNTRDITFSQETISGEKLPSNTPATTSAILDSNIKKFFDKKREDFGLFLKELLTKDIMPMFIKDNADEHIFSISGSFKDRDYFEQLILDARLSAAFQNYIEQNRAVPSAEAWMALAETEARRLASRPSIDIRIPKDFYANFKYRLDVVITKENEDTDAQIQGRLAILNALGANPDIAINPTTRPIFLELAELYGIKNLRLPNIPRPIQQPQMAQAPGVGVASPAAPAVANRGAGAPTRTL